MAGGGRFSVIMNAEATGFESVEAHGRLLATKFENIGIALEIASKEFALLIEEAFDTEGKTTGGWEDLKESTVRERTRLGYGGEHPILYRRGTLKNAATKGAFIEAGFITPQTRNFVYRVDARGANGANYAAVMQHGGAKARGRYGTNASIPARPFLPPYEQLNLVLLRSVEGYLSAGPGGFREGNRNYQFLGNSKSYGASGQVAYRPISSLYGG